MNLPDAATLRSEVEGALIAAGLDAVGVTGVEPFPRVRHSLEARRRHGYHAGMSFTFRNPRRSTEPARLLRRAASIVVGALGYAEPVPGRPDGSPGPAARVARYAWRDHYADLRGALGAGADVLRAAGHRATIVTDQNGLVDRAAAYRAGIGWWGRNSNLLIPGLGSWFVLGAIVTDASLPADDRPVADGCRSCTACVQGCPTDAIVDDGVIDARRCLAWLVQDTGVFPRAYRAALGDRLYGCDDCQDVCPPGRRSVAGPQPVEITPRPDLDAWVPVLELLSADDDSLMARYGRWYIPDRDPRYLRRNALVVLGNVGTASAAEHDVIERHLGGADPLVRAHAVWAAARLGFDDLVASAADDDEAIVRAEVAMAPGVARAPAVRPTVAPGLAR